MHGPLIPAISHRLQRSTNGKQLSQVVMMKYSAMVLVTRLGMYSEYLLIYPESIMGNKCCRKQKTQSAWDQWSLYNDELPPSPPSPLYDRLINLPPVPAQSIPWREPSHVPPDLAAMNATARSHWLHPYQPSVQGYQAPISVWGGHSLHGARSSALNSTNQYAS